MNEEANMAEPKTKPTEQSVESFINGIPDEKKRNDCLTIVEMMKKAANAEPVMWGSSIVGFGLARLKYKSGREDDWPVIAFSPRKQALTLYLNGVFDRHEDLMQRLGKYKTGGGCLYIKTLADVDHQVLLELIEHSVKFKTEQLSQE
jgi:hypothetical protein